MTTETILTDAEIITIGHQARGIEPGENGYILPVTFARAIEQAVLAKLAEQEPVAWIDVEKLGVMHKDSRFNRVQWNTVLRVSKVEDDEIPLYAHPCVSPASDKTACVSENTESDIQRHLDYIKRYQKWRRGEDKTMGEMGLTPKQIGEALDWLIGVAENHIAAAKERHRSTKNHIADMRKKVPEGWRLVPDQLNNEMAQALRLGSRKDYPSDLLCEVRYTALLAAAPKYTGESK